MPDHTPAPSPLAFVGYYRANARQKWRRRASAPTETACWVALRAIQQWTSGDYYVTTGDRNPNDNCKTNK